MVKAPQVHFNIDGLRTREDTLFGSASDENNVPSHQSLLRLRLSTWDGGKLTSWPTGELKEKHPEVGFPVGAELYLGFGPLAYDKATKGTALGTNGGNKRTAIDDKSAVALRLLFPDEHTTDLQNTLQLAAWFGTLGSRARNGWGSLQIAHQHLKPLTRQNLERIGITRPLQECLTMDWPHAIGESRGAPLVWKTRVEGSWRQVMKELARIKIAFRTQPALSLKGVVAGAFSKRHLLAYPITHHAVAGTSWGGQGRLANQVRFKVLREEEQLVGVIVHVPCSLPEEMARNLPAYTRANLDQQDVWEAVHTVLDNNANRLV
ncbi:MAG: hypothetical protein ABTS16_02130 [Candidatus Accumulibacter phosphatis]|uniref:Uncharacterized protein n=1 Tax=Candidatus Accumulibacter contiguus TaxID=2954381 RepID=A0ABX1TEL5_9PROT|nr:hypothetical protein [Candidatus Accumulibacter contiguus]NMQ07499.1 hypothetical protein [Candidatus Accumulibacter contiguus]